MISFFWEDWFGERGYVPNYVGGIWFPLRTPVPDFLHPILPQGMPRIDLIYGVTDPRVSACFYAVVTVAALFTALGLFTRYSAFILAVGYVSLHHRNGAILHGGDTVMRLLAIYLAVSPCGRACSLDRLIGLLRGTVGHAQVMISVWSQRLIAFNSALLYFTTIWLKWDGSHWRNFTATYYPERLAEFYRFPYPSFFQSLWIAKVSTAMTIVVEFALGTIVFFPPARKYILLAGVLMHGWIEYSMNIPLFSFCMISTYLAFYQGEEIEAWAKRWGMRLRKQHVTVRLPENSKLSPTGVAVLSAVDPFGLITYLPGTHSTIEATRFDGSPISVSKGIGTRSIGLWIVAWFPGFVKSLLPKLIERESGSLPSEKSPRAERQPAGT